MQGVRWFKGEASVQGQLMCRGRAAGVQEQLVCLGS